MARMEAGERWWDFGVGEYVVHSGPMDDEAARRLLPQDWAVQTMYTIRREEGMAALEAMDWVLEVCCGE